MRKSTSKRENPGGKDFSGKRFESLTAEVFSILVSGSPNVKVERDIHLESPEGSRQIDVLIITKTGPLELTTMVECRDYNKVVTLTDVDGVHSVMRDVNANQAVIVTRVGFSGNARKKAKRLGITLFTLNEARDSKWELVQKFPIQVTEHLVTKVDLHFSIVERNNVEIVKEAYFDGIESREFFRRLFLASKLPVESSHGGSFDLLGLFEKIEVFDDTGALLDVTAVEFDYIVEENIFFGYIDEPPGTLTFQEIGKSNVSKIFRAEEVGESYKLLQKFTRGQDLPAIPLLKIRVLGVPEMHYNGSYARHDHKNPSLLEDE